jgi:hypothetical protein
VLWIRIRKDPHNRIKIYNLDPEPDPNLHQFADVKPKCMEYEPILALTGIQRFEHFFEARIWIRMRTSNRVKSRIRIRIKQKIRIQIRIRIRIRIRIKVMQINNTGNYM